MPHSQFLDMVTELRPNLRKLPFDEFVSVMCRPMVDTEQLEDQLRGTFTTFAGGKPHITAASLAESLAELGRPVDPLVAEEMIHEAERGDDGVARGKVSVAEFCTVNSVREGKVKEGAAAEPAS